MAARLSARERKLLALSPNTKAKQYGGLALEVNELVDELVELQDLLIYKSFTNEVEDKDILELKNNIDKIAKEVNKEFDNLMKTKQPKAYVKGVD